MTNTKKGRAKKGKTKKSATGVKTKVFDGFAC